MKLLNFGSCNIDYVYTVEHALSVGETQGASSFRIFSGGKGLNQSIAAASAGACVYHAGCVGVDGDFLVRELNARGVDTSYLKKVSDKNGHAVIIVTEKGENAIIVHPGSNALVSRELADGVLRNFTSENFVLLQNEISEVEYIIDAAHKKGMTVIFNPSPINDSVKRIDFNKISYLLLNETEAEALSGYSDAEAALSYFEGKYPALKIVLTLGADGSLYRFRGETVYQPSFCVEVKDTTAAGDTFTGYFISEIMKGSAVKKALETASLAAALAVSKEGAAPSIPLYEELLAAKKELSPRSE